MDGIATPTSSGTSNGTSEDARTATPRALCDNAPLSLLDAIGSYVANRAEAAGIGPRSPLAIATLITLVGLGVVVLLAALGPPYPRPYETDFMRLFAGAEAWARGANPYEIAPGAAPFFYPPNAVLIFAPSGLAPMNVASAIWAVASLFLVGLASIYFAKIAAQRTRVSFVWASIIHLFVLAALWYASTVILRHNNLGLFTYAAFILFLFGVETNGSRPIAIGLIAMLIKPQLGAPLAIAALLTKQTRRPALWALFASAIFGFIGLFIGADGIGDAVTRLSGFFRNTAAYAAQPENQPPEVSGVEFFWYLATGGTLSPFLLLTASLIATALIIRMRSDTIAENVSARADTFMLVAAVSLLIMSSHNNYYTVLTPAIFLIPVSLAFRALLCVGALLLMRTWDLANIAASAGIGYRMFNVSAIDSIAIALVVLALFAGMRSQRHYSSVICDGSVNR